MKKTILIASGIVIILLIISVWVYLLINGRPNGADDVFTQFNFSDTESSQEIVREVSTVNENSVSNIDMTPQKLKQLTTKPVAGAGFFEDRVIYVEQGTGHVYEIDLVEGTEELSSGTTITQTTDAYIGDDGVYIAITSLSSGSSKTVVGKIVNNSLVGKQLPLGAVNIEFKNSTEIFYSLSDNTGTVGYVYDIESEENTVVFSSPLRDIVILWGETIYIYTTPSNVVEGYVYKIGKQNRHEFVTNGSDGLVALRTYGHILVSSLTDRHSKIFESESLEEIGALPVIIPEKCIAGESVSSLLLCASPKEFSSASYPDSWYKGLFSYDDNIVMMDIENNQTRVLLNLMEESGRKIDVSKIGTNSNTLKLYLINKNDNTLWLYDRTVQ